MLRGKNSSFKHLKSLETEHDFDLSQFSLGDFHQLDIASGEGFGSAILAKTARRVVGVDIAMEIVQHASIRYQLDNVRFSPALARRSRWIITVSTSWSALRLSNIMISMRR